MDFPSNESQHSNDTFDARFLWKQRPALSTASLFSTTSMQNTANNHPTSSAPPLDSTQAASDNNRIFSDSGPGEQSSNFVFQTINNEQTPSSKRPPSPVTRNYLLQQQQTTLSSPRFSSSLPQLNSAARRTPTPTPITDVMAAMTDQTRAVQALKEAVSGVDSLRSPLSDETTRNQWRQSSNTPFRSKSVDQFYRYQEPFAHRPHPQQSNNEYPIPSFTPQSVYGDIRGTTGKEINNTSNNHMRVQGDGGAFEKKMHQIVNNAVSQAIISRENLLPTNSTAFVDTKQQQQQHRHHHHRKRNSSSSNNEHSHDEAELDDAVMHESELSGNHDMSAPSMSPIVRAPSANRQHASSTSPSKNSSPTRKLQQSENASTSQRKHTSKHQQQQPPQRSKSSSSTAQRSVLGTSESSLIASLSEKVDRLMSRIQELESRDLAETAIHKFDTEKIVKSRLKMFESRMDGLDAKMLQMEARMLVAGRGGENTSSPKLVRTLETSNRRLQSQLDESQESIKVLQGRFDFQLVAMENLRSAVKGTTNKNGAEGDGQIREVLEKNFAAKIEKVLKTVNGKVDTVVLEELMRHLATRDELKRMYEKLSNKETTRKLSEKDMDQIKRDLFDELKKQVEVRLHNFKTDIVHEQLKQPQKAPTTSVFHPQRRESNSVSLAQLHETLDVLEHRWMQQLEQATTSPASKIPSSLISELKEDILDHVKLSLSEQMLDQTGTTMGTPASMQANKPLQTLISSLTREFDEKLYLLCADLSACKTAYQTAVRQPFYRCGHWLWTSSTLKLGSSIPWNLQSTNTDPMNFKWEKDVTCIRVQEAGFYEISFAFFDVSWKPSVQVVVNGESVMSALNSPAYVVHHSSGFVRNGDGDVRPGTVTGLSLIDFLSLPAKSTVALHYHGGKKELVGHGFLGIRRL
ncbi:hypothetical protein BDR26DRAFT_1011868 [Obelidium mucronatum]|nr:hypothetical protein BDR26DRAFT_1011868 [Obelidium mucronatum]